MCVCVCICAGMYVCMYAYTYVYVCMYVYVHMCMYVYMNVHHILLAGLQEGGHVTLAVEKALKVHREDYRNGQHNGHILVFLTGQEDIESAIRNFKGGLKVLYPHVKLM
jgi:HrpA-like RNA helicase